MLEEEFLLLLKKIFNSKDQLNQPLHTLTIPVSLQRCGIEAKLIVANGEIVPPHQDSFKALQAALLKALKWNDELMNQTDQSVRFLAKREQVTEGYTRRILSLAYLAPDIMEAIVQAKIPSHFTLEKLRKSISLDWNQQPQLL